MRIPPQELLQRLIQGLGPEGDFPAPARLVSSLQMLCRDSRTPLEELGRCVMHDPFLGVRALHIANTQTLPSSRGMFSVEEAVHILGKEYLLTWCSKLVTAQTLLPATRSGGIFESILTHSFATILLTELIGRELSYGKPFAGEVARIGGTVAAMGALLPAFYWPHLLTNTQRSTSEQPLGFSETMDNAFGTPPLALGAHLATVINLPRGYGSMLKTAIAPLHGCGVPASEHDLIALSIFLAHRIAEAMIFGDRPTLGATLRSLADEYLLDFDVFRRALRYLDTAFDEQCSMLDLNLLLPEYVASYARGRGGGTFTTKQLSLESIHQLFIDDLRKSVHNKEPLNSILGSVLEFIAWELGYERVLFLAPDPQRKRLVGSHFLGLPPLDPSTITVNSREASPVVHAIASAYGGGDIATDVPPLLEGGLKPLLVPFGYKRRARGIIYADRTTGAPEMMSTTRASLQLICELLDESTKYAMPSTTPTS